MNRERRKTLSAVADLLEQTKTALDDIQCQEAEYRDNMPENMQGSERHETADAACDSLSEAVGLLEEIIDSISGLIEG